MFRYTISGAQAAIEHLSALPDAVQAALLARAGALSEAVQAAAQTTVSPSGVLGQAIGAEATTDGMQITGRVFVAPGVPYAAALERGFDGVEAVAPYTRTITQAFGRVIAPITIAVSGFSRDMHIPARGYLSGALNDQADNIVDALTAAALDSLEP